MTEDMKTRWGIEDYLPVATLSGAEKLADSQVAPLVAQARGYQTVVDDEGAREVAKAVYTTDERKIANRLKTMTKNDNDFTVIPLFKAATVISGGASAKPDAIQVRPSTPLPNAKGKPAKYEVLSGHASVIDANPGTPEEWFSHTTKFLITEGSLKGDSAVSAQLLAAGITHDELAAIRGTEVEEARVRLQQLMLRVPVRDRVPVLSLVGVANWHQNSEWNSLVFRDRDILVAFDGDLRQNRQVWNQAERMWRFIDESKHGNPKLLDLGGANAEKDQAVAGYAAGKKVGIDDYLSHIGGWGDAMKLVEDSLPPQPERNPDDDARPGDFRVNDDGTAVFEYTKQESVGFDGGMGGVVYAWQERVALGGRVKQASSLRVLTDVDVREGLARPGAVVDSAKGDCTIELKWVDDQTGATITRDITGPRAILETSPAEWGRKGALIHTDILRHPAWPPRNKNGDGFLAAIKANRVSEQIILDGWDTMGYVPTASGMPVYVVGNQSLGASREDEKDNRPGVTEELMPKASSYGVNDTYWRFLDDGDLEGWKAQIRDDIRTVVAQFITDSPWTNPAIGPTVLACALRPTMPTRTHTALFLSGGPGSGKSYIASFQQAFWGSSGGVWTEHNLPGSANDTPVAHEHSRARTPFYVIDDLAPGSSRQAAELLEAIIENVIRAGHNGSGKRRGTADGDQRAVSHPRALVVITGENEMSTLSIRQRIITIHLSAEGKRQDSERDRLRELEKVARSPENPFARLTAAMIRFWLNVDLDDTVLPMLRRDDSPGSDSAPENLSTWEGKYRFAHSSIAAAKSLIQEQLEERYGIATATSARRAGMFAELLFTFDVLQSLALWAGLSPKDVALKPFFAKPNEIGTLRGAMIDLAAQDLFDFRSKSNSRNLLEAIRNLLEAGKAHLEHPTISGSRPVQYGPDADRLNKAAGWRFDPRSDQWLPSGTPIGYLGVPTDSEEHDDYVALVSTANAFNLAQREHPALVPAGQKAGDTWSQVWEDENGVMVHSRYQRPANGREYTVKTRIVDPTVAEAAEAASAAASGGVPSRHDRLRGVPLRFKELLSEDGD